MNHQNLRLSTGPLCRRLRGLIPALTLAAAGPASAGHPTELPAMAVEDAAQSGERYRVDLQRAPVTSPDVGGLLRRTPGGQVNRNGGLTGIAQYRGLFGSRVNVLVDGMHINGGGPNAMDTPLSYIPRAQLASLEVTRGIAPVSAGLETLGGSISARSRGSQFEAGTAFVPHLEIGAGAASVNDSSFVNLLATLANDRQRAHVSAGTEYGSHTDIPGGRILPSRYERQRYGLGYGLRSGSHEISLDYGRNETGKSGTPSLPMDIILVDSDLLRAGYQGQLGAHRVTGQLSWSDIYHEMSNFVLRNPPGLTRMNATDSTGFGWKLTVSRPLGAGLATLGVDGHLAGHNATISDPNNAMFRVDNFNDIQRDRYGVFGEWMRPLGEANEVELGLRYTRVDMDAGEVGISMPPGSPPANLAARFNAAERARADDNLDWVVEWTHHAARELDIVVGVARKTRSPSYQERYLWLPLESTAGLADGNRYVGDIDLDPEVSHQLELGLDWGRGGHYASPRLFYREVADYIQGTPASDPLVIGVSTANGDPTPLQFSNVDATLYGADMAFGAALGGHWHVDGVLSYVRGKRDDIDDNLYRIYPLTGSLALAYHRERWSLSAETLFAARQDRVSATNNERPTGGYGVLNLQGQWRLAPGLLLTAGVENLFDKRYAEHTTGINRVMGVDLQPGERIPSPGRSVYLSLDYRY